MYVRSSVGVMVCVSAVKHANFVEDERCRC